MSSANNKLKDHEHYAEIYDQGTIDQCREFEDGGILGGTESAKRIWEDGDSQFVMFSKRFLRGMDEKDRSRRRYGNKRISSINVEDAKALAVSVFMKGLPWGTKNPKPQWKDFFKNMGTTHVANK